MNLPTRIPSEKVYRIISKYHVPRGDFIPESRLESHLRETPGFDFDDYVIEISASGGINKQVYKWNPNEVAWDLCN